MSAATSNSSPNVQNTPNSLDAKARDDLIREGRGRARGVIRDWNLKHAFINGVWRAADSRETLDVIDPAVAVCSHLDAIDPAVAICSILVLLMLVTLKWQFVES